MSKYINADNAVERLGQYLMADAQIEYAGTASEDIEDWKELASDILKGTPSIDIDRPQGEWRKRFGSINCSVCKHSNWSYSFEDLLRSFNFCPNCGAKMKGADDERSR